jgi:CheY-like chemotaxis protein
MIAEHCFLYVEDDPLSREALDVILRRVMKIERLTVFADSSDFLARVRALPYTPDVFLLDIHVAPYSGFEMLEQLRAQPAYASARIIALTASVMNEEVAMLRERGFDGVIAKPINVSNFSRLLTRILAGETVWSVVEEA